MNIRQMGCSQLCKHLLILLVGAFAGISQAAVWTDDRGVEWTYQLSGTDAAEVCSAQPTAGELVVPQFLGGSPVKAIRPRAFVECADLRSIVMPESVVAIGSCAFSNCTALAYVRLPAGLMSLGAGAFAGCAAIADVSLPNCLHEEHSGSLDSLTLAFPDAVASVTNAVVCEGVTLMGETFVNCTELVSVTLPSTLTSIYGSFKGCSKLHSVDIPSGVNTISESSFQGCSSLAEVKLPDALKTIASYSFDGNSSLTNVVIPSGVTKIDMYAFNGCTALESVDIPASVTSIGTSAFGNCPSIRKVTVPRAVTSISTTFPASYAQICDVTLAPNVYSVGTELFKGMLALEKLSMIGVTDVNAKAFDVGCSVKELEVSGMGPYEDLLWGGGGFESFRQTVTNLVVVDEVYWFSQWTALESVTIVDSPIISGGAFAGCTALRDIKISESVVQIGEGVIADCPQFGTGLIIRDGWVLGYVGECPEEVVIPDGVIGIADYAFKGQTGLRRVRLPAGLVSIPTGCFRDCSALEDINMPDTVTVVGDSAFALCSNVVNVTLSKSLKELGDNAFDHCGGIPTVDGFQVLDGWLLKPVGDCPAEAVIPEGVKHIAAKAFSGCDSLVSVVFPSSLEHIGSYAFSRCQGLTSLWIPSEVRVDEYAIYNCDSIVSLAVGLGAELAAYSIYCAGIKDVTVPGDISESAWGWNVKYSVTNVTICAGSSCVSESLFYGFSKLTSVSLPESVTEIGEWAFGNCSALKDVRLPLGLVSIDAGAFFKCTSLSAVEIPAGVTTVADRAFEGCTGIRSLVVPGAGMPVADKFPNAYAQVTNVVVQEGTVRLPPSAFQDCESLLSVTLPPSVTEIGSAAFSGCTLAEGLELPSPLTKVEDWAFNKCPAIRSVTFSPQLEEVGRYAFYQCANLTEINFCEGLKKIGEYAFYQCPAIGSLSFAASLEEIGPYAFYRCANLEKALFREGLTTVGEYGFFECTALAEIDLPRSLVNIGLCAFKGCPGIKDEVVIVDGTLVAVQGQCPEHFIVPEGVTKIAARAFYGCKELASVEFPSSLKEIETYAFYGCSGLTNVVFSEGLEVIGGWAFCECIGLTDIVLPHSVDEIGAWVFGSCENIRNFAGPYDAVASLRNSGSRKPLVTNIVVHAGVEILPEDAFEYLVNLQSVTLPDTVTEIGEDAFEDCTALVSFNIPSSVRHIGPNAFSGCMATFEDGVIVRDGWVLGTKNTTTTGYFDYAVPEGVVGVADGAFKGTTLREVSYPSTLRYIGGEAFYNCRKFGYDLVLPSGLVEIGPLAFSECKMSTVTMSGKMDNIGQGAFKNCTSLQTVKLPDELRLIGKEAFSGCLRIESLTMPQKLTEIGDSAFYGEYTGLPNEKLEAVVIPEGTRILGSGAFQSCTKLVTANIPSSVEYVGIGCFAETALQGTAPGFVMLDGWVIGYNGNCPDVLVFPEGIRGICCGFDELPSLWSVHVPDGARMDGTMFWGCTGLFSVRLPSDLTAIPSKLFSYCQSLCSVTIPNGVTTIGAEAFANCSLLTALELPESLVFIENDAFSRCSGLRTVNFHESVTDIGASAFAYCGSLVSITLPASLQSIGAEVFESCSSLESVTFLGNCPDYADYVYRSTPTGLTTYVPVGSTGWNGDPNSDALPAAWPPIYSRTIRHVETNPLPEVDPHATAGEIRAILEGAADKKLAQYITDVATYNSFRGWAAVVKDANGNLAGPRAVFDCPFAWLSFASMVERLVMVEPKQGDLTIDGFEPATEAGTFAFTVGLKGVPIGSAALADHLKTVFGLEGAGAVDGSYEPEAVDVVFDAPVEGKLKFRAGPKDKSAPACFMRATVSP